MSKKEVADGLKSNIAALSLAIVIAFDPTPKHLSSFVLPIFDSSHSHIFPFLILQLLLRYPFRCLVVVLFVCVVSSSPRHHPDPSRNRKDPQLSFWPPLPAISVAL